MNSDSTKKYKRPKLNTSATTNPSTSSTRSDNNEQSNKPAEPLCPLLAKDSEWVDILQTPQTDLAKTTSNVSDEEEVLQLVECEDSPQMRPLAIMFPGLLEKDPQTLQGMLNKAMSTTEVTRQLVDLGQKANFTFMKKADRLIPPEKQWMESLTENSSSHGSVISEPLSNCISSDYEDSENPENDLMQLRLWKRKKHRRCNNTTNEPNNESPQKILNQNDEISTPTTCNTENEEGYINKRNSEKK